MVFIFLISLFSVIANSQAPLDTVSFKKDQKTTGSVNNNTFPWQWIIPGTLVGLGVWGNFDNNIINRNELKEERYEYLSSFNKRSDDYLPYVSGATVYILHAAGVKPKHDVINYSVILVKSELVMIAVTSILKKSTHVLRPDSSAYNSFPSGHTAQAFVMANFLRHEFGHRSIWYSVAGYAFASGVGILRIANNRHWISDVLAGAGIGILSSELAYATHKYRWNKKNKLSFFPTYSQTGPGFYLAWQL